MLLRPYGIIVDGELELGLEALFDEDKLVEIRPHTGLPDDYVLSPAFVNAHSHLEYRGMLGKLDGFNEYWPWIREITRLKQLEPALEIDQATLLAAQENAAVGVAWIGEHSDRSASAAAMIAAGVSGVVFQELITFFEAENRAEKWTAVEAKAAAQRSASGPPVFLAPHAPYTVDESSLRRFAQAVPFSIHVAETRFEREWLSEASGPIADFRRSAGFKDERHRSPVAYLDFLGLAHSNAQYVHVCDMDPEDIATLSLRGVRVAHCPRSNARLGCPIAPVRRMLESGIQVGLGMDSAASGGPIDIVAEMRSALHQSVERGEPLSAEQVWRMATNREALPGLRDNTDRWIKIHASGAHTVEELLSSTETGKCERLFAANSW